MTEYFRHFYLGRKETQQLSGVCCQWRGSPSYVSEVPLETFVLRGKFCGKIIIEQ